MKRFFQMFIVCAALALIPGANLTSRAIASELKLPTIYEEHAVTEAGNAVRAGYELLDAGDLEGALAKFAEAGKLVPCGLAQEYHSACASARTGNKDQAFHWLQKLVNNGYDTAARLAEDPDFDPLKDDPRFERILGRARANYETGSASFTEGIPDRGSPPDSVTTEEELNAWVNRETSYRWLYYSFWTSIEQLTKQVDVASRRLTALKKFKAGDPEFDYGMERVKAAYNLENIFMPGWGAATDITLHEVDAYLKTSPGAEKAGKASYYAGTALSLKYPENDDRAAGTFKSAVAYLDKIEAGTEYYGAARIMKLINEFRSPGADEKTLGTKIKKVIGEYPGDEKVYAVVSSRLNTDAVSLLWPIPLGLTDLDGDPVTIAGYAGKVLLIDFWATWCGPCRAELPTLVEVYEKYHPNGFEVLSISLDYENRTTTEAYREWIAENKMNWRHVYDGEGWETEVVKRFFIGGIPAPFLVGPDGSLAAWGEDCRGEKLAATVEKALGAIGN